MSRPRREKGPDQRPLEKTIEASLRRYCVTKGVRFYKFKSPAHPSVTDRILVSPKGRSVARILFLELKRPGEVPTPLQLLEMLDLTERGADARWSDNLDEMKGWVDDLCS